MEKVFFLQSCCPSPLAASDGARAAASENYSTNWFLFLFVGFLAEFFWISFWDVLKFHPKKDGARAGARPCLKTIPQIDFLFFVGFLAEIFGFLFELVCCKTSLNLLNSPEVGPFNPSAPSFKSPLQCMADISEMYGRLLYVIFVGAAWSLD